MLLEKRLILFVIIHFYSVHTQLGQAFHWLPWHQIERRRSFTPRVFILCRECRQRCGAEGQSQSCEGQKQRPAESCEWNHGNTQRFTQRYRVTQQLHAVCVCVCVCKWFNTIVHIKVRYWGNLSLTHQYLQIINFISDFGKLFVLFVE